VLGLTGPFLVRAAERVIDHFAADYPELAAARQRILGVIGREEENFLRTFDQGLARPEEVFFQRYDLSKIDELLGTVSEREALILRLRFGLDPEVKEPMTLKEIGKRIGLTRERVRQIESEALRRLQKVMTSDDF
jgi:RNA polymerase sigma factor (sigma-70 family)